MKVKVNLFKYIETFYNRKCLHSKLDYKSPIENKNAN
jgi:transposase InsO family protein